MPRDAPLVPRPFRLDVDRVFADHLDLVFGLRFPGWRLPECGHRRGAAPDPDQPFVDAASVRAAYLHLGVVQLQASLFDAVP